MILEIAIAALVGAALGLKFQAFMLIPASLIGVAIAIAVGATTGAGVWWICLDTFIVAASLQFGYLVGVAGEFLGYSSAGRALRPADTPKTSPPLP